MGIYEVSANGVIFGDYEADCEQHAKDKCAIDAGYRDEKDMEIQLGQDSDLVATEYDD